MAWRERNGIDPAIWRGQARISVTRVPAALVLDNLAAGLSSDEIGASHATLRVKDICAAPQGSRAQDAEINRSRHRMMFEVGERRRR